MSCFLEECGCFSNISLWCNINNSKHKNPYCLFKKINCLNCYGLWCDIYKENQIYNYTNIPTDKPTDKPTYNIYDKQYIFYGSSFLLLIVCYCLCKKKKKDNFKDDTLWIENPIK